MSGGTGYKYWRRTLGSFVGATRDFITGCLRVISAVLYGYQRPE